MLRILGRLAAALALASPFAHERRTDEIVLGMSTALTGPAADLGVHARAGVEAALAEANASGGVRSRKLRLVALDDGYEPARTAPNMHALIERHGALAVIGNVGTPTAIAALPIAVESKTPFFGAVTGAGVLRKKPPERWVVNYRASYAEEMSAMVDALIDSAGVRPDEVAFFTQRDSYGDAGFAGGIAALKRRGLADEMAVAHGRYERNSTSVENGLADVLQAEIPPRAVILVGAYAPCAAFIRRARRHGLDALFLNLSFVGAESLARTAGPDGEGVVVTQVVPHVDADLPAVRDYRRAMARLEPAAEISFGSLETYLAARVLLRALDRVPGAPTGSALIDALESLGEIDLGLGRPLRLDASEHQASHGVWPTVIRGRKVVPLEWSELRAPVRAATR